MNASGHTGLFAIRSDGEVGAVLALSSSRAAAPDKAWTALGDGVNREVTRIDGGAALRCSRSATAAELVTDAVHGLGESAHVAEVALAMDARGRGRSTAHPTCGCAG